MSSPLLTPSSNPDAPCSVSCSIYCGTDHCENDYQATGCYRHLDYGVRKTSKTRVPRRNDREDYSTELKEQPLLQINELLLRSVGRVKPLHKLTAFSAYSPRTP
jgi:hypothetical protein